jgi:TolA-binding protein
MTPAPSIAPAPSSTERHFQTGWTLLRDGKYNAAAAELALAASGTEPLASDARYFQAIALTKARRAKEAETAIVAFLNNAPTSTRRGRAAVMLGRLLAARGDTKSARAWFSSALGDPDASVAGAAKAELGKLP